MYQKKFFNIAIFVIILGGVVLLLLTYKEDPVIADKNNVIQCIKNNGSQFYGAFWCPHCGRQKDLLGNRKNNYNYIECSTKDAKDTTQVCKDEKINNYPTWKFKNDPRVCRGVTPIRVLANITGCDLPLEVKNKTPKEYIALYVESRLENDGKKIKAEDRAEIYKNIEEIFSESIKDETKDFQNLSIEVLVEIETNLHCGPEDLSAKVQSIEYEPNLDTPGDSK